MKRRRLEKHLKEHGCYLASHGARHDQWWNPKLRRESSIPRHTDIKKFMARVICEQLGVPPLKGD